jgi:cyclopropane fatty-acyl-phospholipid synthase-like methyltransferase
MNQRIRELAEQAFNEYESVYKSDANIPKEFTEKFAELIVKEMCDMMEQAEDDSYHCFEPSERPMDYIRFLYDWRTRFEKHFGVEE